MAARQADVFGDDTEETAEHLGRLPHRMRTRNDLELWRAGTNSHRCGRTPMEHPTARSTAPVARFDPVRVAATEEL
jgi:hypothetical protein